VELDDAVRNVETLFRTLCPGAEFIERVPNPEDVDWSAPEEQQAQEQEQKRSGGSRASASSERRNSNRQVNE
jgi:hypothetical protein